jgi:site-specific DNA-cytosine methylase
MLDVGCGRGGMSNGFAAEGFDVTGIDIVDAPNLLGYPYKFVQGDIRNLDGSQFRGFDVIHGSMPCRNFSIIAKTLGQYWKNPPNIEAG